MNMYAGLVRWASKIAPQKLMHCSFITWGREYSWDKLRGSLKQTQHDQKRGASFLSNQLRNAWQRFCLLPKRNARRHANHGGSIGISQENTSDITTSLHICNYFSGHMQIFYFCRHVSLACKHACQRLDGFHSIIPLNFNKYFTTIYIIKLHKSSILSVFCHIITPNMHVPYNKISLNYITKHSGDDREGVI